MFNFLVKTGSWQEGTNALPISRFLENTGDALAESIRSDISLLENCPTLLMSETRDDGQPAAKIGDVTSIQRTGSNIRFEVSFREDLPTLHNEEILRIATSLSIEEFEFSRGHWAVKPGKLFELLFASNASSAPSPTAFNIDFSAAINPVQVSAMMPFSSPFTAVYETIRQVSNDCGMVCNRADDIWVNDQIIQDVVDLIASSRIVICDCTGRNPNVFYEAGIAHTLGRNVIIIAQNAEDVPFDIQHIRHIRYLNNSEGMCEFATTLESRMRDLRNR